jgi:hypothetical protein
MALETYWGAAFLLLLLRVLMPVIVSLKLTSRAPGKENVPVNLHHLIRRRAGARMQVVHILRDQQELVCVAGKSCDCFVRNVRSCVADALPPFAVPVPN